MFDAPEPAGGGPERDAPRPPWREVAAEVWACALALADRHWIGAVWGASAACWVIGFALDAPRLVHIGQAPLLALVAAHTANLFLAVRGSDWQVSWCPPSLWRLGLSRRWAIVRVGPLAVLRLPRAVSIAAGIGMRRGGEGRDG